MRACARTPTHCITCELSRHKWPMTVTRVTADDVTRVTGVDVTRVTADDVTRVTGVDVRTLTR